MAASEQREEAGSDDYQDHHFGKILKEGFSFSGFERDHLWVNRGGERFVDISGITGIDSPTDGRGAAYGDLDNDGDLDLFVTAFQGRTHHLFRNNIGNRNAFLRLDLEGTTSGRDAFGAIVRVKTSRGVQTKLKSGGSGYVSSSDPRLLFGLGDDTRVETVEVTWPTGKTETFGPFAANTSWTLTEGGDAATVDESAFALANPATAEETMASMLRVQPGETLPDLPLVAKSGETSLHAAVAGRSVTLVNLWATWCASCQREMPAIEALAQELGPQGFGVVGLSVDTGAAQRLVPRTAQRLGVSYPIFTSDEPVYPHIFSGEEVFIPLSFVVDEQGTVLEVLSGWSDAAEQKIRNLVP